MSAATPEGEGNEEDAEAGGEGAPEDDADENGEDAAEGDVEDSPGAAATTSAQAAVGSGGPLRLQPTSAIAAKRTSARLERTPIASGNYAPPSPEREKW